MVQTGSCSAGDTETMASWSLWSALQQKHEKEKVLTPWAGHLMNLIMYETIAKGLKKGKKNQDPTLKQSYTALNDWIRQF